MSVSIYPTIDGRRHHGAPMCNFANGNVRALLATVGIDAGEYLVGEICADEVECILRDCKIAMGDDADAMVRRAPMLRQSHGDRFRVCGSDDAAARARVSELITVLTWAHERGHGVAWS